MELIKEDGKYYIKTEVTSLVQALGAAKEDMDGITYVRTPFGIIEKVGSPYATKEEYEAEVKERKDTAEKARILAEDKEAEEAAEEEVTYLKGPFGPQWGVPGEL